MHDDRTFTTTLTRGPLGFGEAYMSGWWDCADLEGMAYRLSSAGLYRMARALPLGVAREVSSLFTNRQTVERSTRVAERHYDMGNDLFFAFLGKERNYSCGLFEGTSDLDEAQHRKMRRLCELLELTEDDHLLDLGGGWGHFAVFAAATTGCRVTSVTISKEQAAYARGLAADLDVEVIEADYRHVTGSFTKVAIVAMLTHVGQKNFGALVAMIDDVLEPGGCVVIETVGSKIAKTNLDPWTDTYIVPGGLVPSARQIDRAFRPGFRRTRTDEFGSHYVKTLRAWNANLENAWPELAQIYPDTTRRMFEYFFLTVAGSFRAGHLLHWHLRYDEEAR